MNQAQGKRPFNMLLESALFFMCFAFVAGSSSSTSIRLAGGNYTAGRVEVLLNGEWGTVCDDSWNIQDATVVCLQLGYPLAISAPGEAFFGRGQGLIHLDDVACQGDEKSILDCPRSSNLNCGHSEDAGVVCAFNVRLSRGNDTSGRVEVFLNGQWGSVCGSSWGINEAMVVCRQLGFSSALRATNHGFFGSGHGKIHLHDVDCNGHERSILHCSRSSYSRCGHAEDTGVVCSLNVRLVGGNETAGRVEIFFNGFWGTVCDDSWDIQDATVVCRMLGFPTAVNATANALFGKGQGPIHVTDLACNGNESSILKCPLYFEHKCGHNEDAGADCLAVRLADGNETAGRVEVFYNGRWGTVCDDSWDILDATVVCRQLGFPVALEATASSFFGESKERIHFDEVACDGSEHSLFDCPQSNIDQSCGKGEDAGVICSADELKSIYLLLAPVGIAGVLACVILMATLCRFCFRRCSSTGEEEVGTNKRMTPQVPSRSNVGKDKETTIATASSKRAGVNSYNTSIKHPDDNSYFYHEIQD